VLGRQHNRAAGAPPRARAVGERGPRGGGAGNGRGGGRQR
jgi:hypothetical protein